jgi:hypothetical protein
MVRTCPRKRTAGAPNKHHNRHFIIPRSDVFFKKTSAAYTEKDLLMIGGMWVVFTIIFEFGFQHYVMGVSWSALLHDYNILAGRLWGFVLLTIFVGPFIIGRDLLRKGR